MTNIENFLSCPFATGQKFAVDLQATLYVNSWL